MEREKRSGQLFFRNFFTAFAFSFLVLTGRGLSQEVSFADGDEKIDFVVYAIDNGSAENFILNRGEQGGASADDAREAYLPLYNSAVKVSTSNNASGVSTDYFNKDFFIIGGTSPQSYIPRVDLTSQDTSSRIEFNVDIDNNSSDDKTLYGAIVDPQNSESLVVFSKSLGTSGEIVLTENQTKTDLRIKFNLADVCAAVKVSNDGDFCDGFEVDAGSPEFKTADLTLYFFISKDSLTEAVSKPNLTDQPNGLFVKLKMSNQVATNLDQITLKGVKNGDQEFTVEYEGSELSEPFKAIAVVYSSSSAPVTNDSDSIKINFPYVEALGTSLNGYPTDSKDPEDGETIGSEGSFKVKSFFETTSENINTREANKRTFENGQTYAVAVAYVDKWYFSSYLSKFARTNPQDVNVFLESQMCFLLSAGFKKDHYVLDFFRDVRDEFFMSFKTGQLFVEWYYQVAPKYAKIIWDSENLSFIVRSLGHIGYFAIKYYIFTGLIFLSFGLLILFVILNRRTRSTHEVLFGVK